MNNRIKVVQGTDSDKVFQVQQKKWWGWKTTSVAWLVENGDFSPCDYIFKTESECIEKCKRWLEKERNKNITYYINL
jgi:hypothetical protein